MEIICDGILLPPLAWKPVISGDEGVAVQVKVVPAIFESRITFEEEAPEQIVCDMEALFTTGAGFIVTRWLAVGPLHPLYVGVTVYVTVAGTIKVLLMVCEGIEAVPEAV